MVNIDTVHQRVLAIANKEQRGYITPQEFNLYANQAQMDIFEQYFYDLNQFARVPGNSTEYSDMMNIIEEKINIFEAEVIDLQLDTNGALTLDIPNLYRMGSLKARGVDIEKLERKQFELANRAPLTRPTESRPVYYMQGNTITVSPPEVDTVNVHYIRRPVKVEWGYVVTLEKALYNANRSVNFELHASEETDLVIKILALAGITMNDASLYQMATQEDIKNVQQEKQ